MLNFSLEINMMRNKYFLTITIIIIKITADKILILDYIKRKIMDLDKNLLRNNLHWMKIQEAEDIFKLIRW